MTHCVCFTKKGRNVDKITNASVNHTNKDCHLKKITCCYAHSPKRDQSPQRTKCEKCCCVITSPPSGDYDKSYRKSGEDYDKSYRKSGEDYDKSYRKSGEDYDKSYRKSGEDYDNLYQKSGEDKFPYKEKAPEKILCEVCCCLLKNCCCREKSPSNLSRPRMLCRDLPLYDEKSHLLGYIKKGAVIDHPSCAKSRDHMFDSGAAQELREKANGTKCMSSCRYAEGIRRQSKATAVPRWTTKSAFQYSTLEDSPISPGKSKKKKCPC